MEMTIAEFFAFWMTTQDPEILSPREAAKPQDISTLCAGDLLSVMFYSEGMQSLKALEKLKELFVDHMNEMEQQTHQGDGRASDWN